MPPVVLRVVNLASRLAVIVGAVALVALVASPDTPRAAPAAVTASPGAIANLQRTVQTLQTRVRRLDKQVKALRLKRGPAGPPGPAGPAGPAGANGTNGRALGFVHVNIAAGNAILLTHNSGGVVVSRADTGLYCIKVPGIDSRQRPASVSTMIAAGGSYLGASATVNSSDALAGCSAGDYEVQTFTIKPTAPPATWTFELANYIPFTLVVS